MFKNLESGGHLLYRKYIGQMKLIIGDRGIGDNVRSRQDVFEENTATLSHHPALVTTYAKLSFDEIEILNDVFLDEGSRSHVTEVGENKAYFLYIISDCARRIGFG